MSQLLKNSISLILLAVFIYIMWALRMIVGYFMIALVLSFIGRPIADFINSFQIKGRRLPYALCAMKALFVMIAILIGIFWIFVPLIAEQARIISDIDMNKSLENLREPIQQLEAFLAKYRLTDSPAIDTTTMVKNKLMKLITFTSVSDIFTTLVGVLGNILVAFLAISFITFFFLKDKDLFSRIVSAITPDKYLDEVTEIIKDSRFMLGRYFRGLFLDVSIVTTLITVGMSIVGVQNAILIGVFAGLVNMIPYVGPLIGASFAILIGFTSNMNIDFYNEMIPLQIKIISIFAGVQLLDGMLIQPTIFSKIVKSHPLEIFLVILSAGTFAGIPAMIIAVPTYTFLRIIAREFYGKSKLVKALTRNL